MEDDDLTIGNDDYGYLTDLIHQARLRHWRKLLISHLIIDTLPTEIFELHQLQVLEISGCKMKNLPGEIGNLRDLRVLKLSANSLSSLPSEIRNLQNLQFLDLDYNPQLGNLENLQYLHALNRLNMSRLQLDIFPEQLTSLSDLAILNMDFNKISELPGGIKHMTNLRVLNLANNGLTDVHPNIGHLHKLRALDLGNNSLERLPKEFRYLRQLKSLSLEYNNFSYFPKIIRQLEKLRVLNLSNNSIRGLPALSGKLENLESLNLSRNSIERIDAEIMKLPKLAELELERNPLSYPPIEIASQGWEAVKNYFAEVQRDTTDFLYEIKLLLVGEGRVGKTSLSKALSLENYILTDEKTTEGIDIKQWVIPADLMGLPKDFRINIWDFGGQEIYHATHQFFLTRRSIYLFVTESRKEDKPEDFYYWLNIIKLLGQGSPVIIVLNKCDEPNTDIPINEYRKMFENIVDFKKVSSMAGYQDTIETLKAEIRRIILGKKLLPHIGSPLPKVWIDIRFELEELKKQGKDYVSLPEYLGICSKHGMNEERASLLSQYFHDLGVVLHFQDDPSLKNTVILNHEWVTEGVYNVLDNKTVIKKYGRFNNHDLVHIWKDPKYRDKYGEMLSLMKNNKFELCFELDAGEYLAPQLLPKDQAPFEWKRQKDNLLFEYRYKFMPKGILTRFIVKRNKDIYKNTYWRYGVLLSSEDTRALVQEKYLERRITIAIEGINKKELLGVVRKTLAEIHGSYQYLEVQEMVPCNCVDCRGVSEPTFFEYSELKKYRRDGFPSIRCSHGKVKDVDIDSMIDDVFERQKSSSDFDSRASNSQIQQTFYIENKGEIKMNEKNERKVEVGRDLEMNGGVMNLGDLSGVVNTGNGKAVGRDDNSQSGLDAETIKELFATLFERVDQQATLSDDEKADLKTDISELRNELAKQDQADETFMMRRLRNIGRMAPDILEVTLATITNPAAGFGLISKKIADKAKETQVKK